MWHLIQSWQREVFGKEDTNNHKTENLAQAIVVYRVRRHKNVNVKDVKKEEFEN